MAESEAISEGLRERKRRETRARITETGLRLFHRQGYESTTIDEIAAEAGISRRSFFSYFKSKDDILLSLQSGMGEQLQELVREQPPGGRPLEAARGAVMRLAGQYADPKELLAIDRLMRSSEAVQDRKQGAYLKQEELLFAALKERWPEENEMALRVVATLAINASRLSIDAWSREGGTRPVTEVLAETFDALERVTRS